MCHQLAEDAVNGVGMEEGYLEPEETRPGLAVDELDTVRRERVQLGLHIVDLVRDVVHPRASLGDELPDGRVLAERAKQLDPALADEHGRCLDALVRHAGAVLELGAEEPLVGRERLVEVLDRDAEVMDPPGLHGADATVPAVAATPEEAARGDYYVFAAWEVGDDEPDPELVRFV